MSFMKFFQIIDKSFIGRFVEKRLELVNSTDPKRIYVENIRSFFNITTGAANFLCEMAVKQKIFDKYFAVECPQCNVIIKSFDDENSIPNDIICEHCQLLEKNKYKFTSKEFLVEKVYRLNNESLELEPLKHGS